MRDYLQDAMAIGHWLRASTVDTPDGVIWPEDIMHPDNIRVSLGSGVSGDVLFFLALYRATNDERYLSDIRRGAAYLLAALPAIAADSTAARRAGSLYGGVPGIAFVLHRAFMVTGDHQYRLGAEQALSLIDRFARTDGNGVAWNDMNDVMNGSAGTGLFLLYALREMGQARSRDLAVAVGEGLLARALPDSGGFTWKAGAAMDLILPNFSHGTAGIGYFLAELYTVTNRREFLDGALGAARYLKAVARTGDGVLLVPYGIPDKGYVRPYDIGWAHGGAGTARLFYKLWTITQDSVWRDALTASARGVARSGVPGPPAAGYGSAPFMPDQRFGVAGVGSFFADLYRATDEASYLALARMMADHLLRQATRDARGLRWRLNRYAFMPRAGEPAEFTGYMYGAAGYGLFLLQLHAAEQGTPWEFGLPDNPFAVYESKSAP